MPQFGEWKNDDNTSVILVIPFGVMTASLIGELTQVPGFIEKGPWAAATLPPWWPDGWFGFLLQTAMSLVVWSFASYYTLGLFSHSFFSLKPPVFVFLASILFYTLSFAVFFGSPSGWGWPLAPVVVLLWACGGVVSVDVQNRNKWLSKMGRGPPP